MAHTTYRYTRCSQDALLFHIVLQFLPMLRQEIFPDKQMWSHDLAPFVNRNFLYSFDIYYQLQSNNIIDF